MKLLMAFILLAILIPQASKGQCGVRQVRGIWQDLPNPVQGTRSTFDVVKLGGGETKAVWFAFHFNNDLWAQFGYSNQFGGTDWAGGCFNVAYGHFGEPCPFFEIVGLNPAPALVVGQRITLELLHVPAPASASCQPNCDDGWWQYSINGTPISAWDYGATGGWETQTAIEQGYSCHAARFPIVNFYPAIEIFRNGVWQDAPKGYPNGNAWGIEGQLQNPALRFNEVRMGSAVPAFNYSTQTYLWWAGF